MTTVCSPNQFKPWGDSLGADKGEGGQMSLASAASGTEPVLDNAAQPLRHSTTKAALTSGGGEIIARGLTVVLSIVTARVLEPREVGVLGLGVIFMSVVSMVGYYPETAAVTAKGNAADAVYALLATLLRAVLIGALMLAILFAYPVLSSLVVGGEQYSGDLKSLLLVLIWVPAFEMLSSYPQIMLQRRLQLAFLARVQFLQPVVFVSLAVGLLVTGSGYLGVAWASVASSALTTLLVWQRIWRLSGVSWNGLRSRLALRETLVGSGRVFAGGFGGYLGERVDNLLVAGVLGPAPMSFYAMAWNASRTPANVFARAVTFVLVPTLARIHEDQARVQRALRECLRHAYLLLVPACAALFVTAPLLVSFVLGPKWLPVAPCLRVMCVTVLVAPFLYVSGALLVGTGRAHLSAIGTVAHLAILGILVPILARRWGIVGAAYADMAATVVLTGALIATAQVATRQLSRSSAATVMLPMAAGVFAGTLAWGVRSFIAQDLLCLICQLGMIMAAYPLTILLLGGRSRLLDLTTLLGSVLRRRVLAAEANG